MKAKRELDLAKARKADEEKRKEVLLYIRFVRSLFVHLFIYSFMKFTGTHSPVNMKCVMSRRLTDRQTCHMYLSKLSLSTYTVSEKKSLQYFMCNVNKFKDIFIIFGTNHPETTLY